MKILHIADTHLGYSAYRKVNNEGVNQREIDTYDAFEQFINYAVKTKPDLILHAGDLFDSVRPTNRAITFAINQILKLSKQKIPLIIIAGNHEHPRLKETGHILSVFDHIENVYPIYKEGYEKINFEIKKEKITIHAIPQTTTKKEFDDNLKKLKKQPDSDYNILVLHGGVTGIKEFSMNEFNELIIPTKILSKDYDYIALGHYHKHTKLSENVYYSGSTESFTFSDAGEQKGFIELELKKDKIKTLFKPLKTRPMINVQSIKCSTLKIEEIMNKIKESIKKLEPKDKIFRLTLDEIPQRIYRSLDFNEIRKISNQAVHYEIKANITKEEQPLITQTSKIDALVNEFKNYLKKQEVEDRDILMKLGIDYIEKIETRDENK